MCLRTIMIFPEFKNIGILDNIRSEYDPLAKLVRPHITLVFPFKSHMSDKELAQILNARLHSLKSFHLSMGGVSKQENVFGNYLFLDVSQGTEEICRIHKMLYDNEFKEFDIGLQYIPHITLGKFDTVPLLDNAFNKIGTMITAFHTTVNRISVEMIGDHEESIIVIEKELL